MNKYAQLITELGGYFVHLQEEPIHLSEADLDAAEKEIGYSFPSDYREFLKDFGGYSIPALFLVPGWEWGVCSVGVCKGISIGTSYGLVSSYKGDLVNKVIAPEMLPISEQEAGKVCLFLAGPEKGTVQFWYRLEVRAPYDYGNLYPVANSFDEFMHLLRKYED